MAGTGPAPSGSHSRAARRVPSDERDPLRLDRPHGVRQVVAHTRGHGARLDVPRLDRGRSRPESEGVRRLLACLLVAAVLPAAASARTAARGASPSRARRRWPSRDSCAPCSCPSRAATGITVRYVSTDGAQALRDVRAGKAHLALSDSAAAEAAFTASASSLEPTGRLVLYGDDVLVGPARDPAGVAAHAPRDIAAALRLIAAAGGDGHSDFIAGGIGQGEAALWQASKVTHGEQPVPVGERWYHYGASDPAAVVRSAAACALRVQGLLRARGSRRAASTAGSRRCARPAHRRRPQRGRRGRRQRGARAPRARVCDEAGGQRDARAPGSAHLARAAGGDRPTIPRPASRPTTPPRRRSCCSSRAFPTSRAG